MNTLLLQMGGEPTPIDAPITFLLLAITVYTSYRVMEDPYEKNKFMFNAYVIDSRKEWFRFLTHGLIHADWMHLLFNMYVLYMFGTQVEMVYQSLFGPLLGPLFYLALYVLGLIMSSVFSFFKHKHNPHYNALGASGAVSGIVFSYILFAPTQGMGLIFLPGIYLPSFFFGLLYLLYSVYMSKKGTDNIGHDAHYWGAVWGFLFTGFLYPDLFFYFISSIKDYLF